MSKLCNAFILITFLCSAAVAGPLTADEFNMEGRRLLTEGKFKEALELADRATAAGVEPFRAGKLKVHAYAGLKEFQKLEETLTGLLVRADLPVDEKPILLRDRASTRAALKKYEEAVTDLEEAIRLQPAHVEAYRTMGKVFLNTGNPRKAVEAFTRALKITPNAPMDLAKRADAYLNLGEFAKAEVDLSAALEGADNDSDKWEWLRNRGIVRTMQNRLSEAEQDLAGAIKLNPSNAKAWFWQGKTREAIGKSEEALEDYSKALSIDSSMVNAWAERGMVKVKLGMAKEALTDFDTALELSPRNPIFLIERAEAYMALRDHDGAELDYTAAIEASPGAAFCRYARAIARHGAGNKKGAIEDYDKALELEPDHEGVLYARGCLRQDLGDFSGAEEDFSKLAGLEPETETGWLGRARARQKLGNLEGALEDANKALSIAPADTAALLTRAEVFEAKGDYKRQEEDSTRALAAQPKMVRALELRAGARLLLGNAEGAAQDAKELLSIEPERGTALLLRGKTKCLAGAFDESIKDQEKAIPLITGSYPEFLLWYATVRAGRAEGAAHRMKDYVKEMRDRKDPSSWAIALAAYLAGEMNEDALKAAAEKAENETLKPGQRCDAAFYAGIMLLQRGDRAGAIELLKQCAAMNPPGYLEPVFARKELERLK